MDGRSRGGLRWDGRSRGGLRWDGRSLRALAATRTRLLLGARRQDAGSAVAQDFGCAATRVGATLQVAKFPECDVTI